MRILICHNAYQLNGGEDAVVESEYELLKSHGHDVELYIVSNDEIRGVLDKVKTGLHASYSESSKERIRNLLSVLKPDVVHFHNTFPLLTPSVYDACREIGVGIVQTLHNFRTICPSALLLRNGKLCELCISGTPYYGTLHKCYRGSRLQSFAVSHMVSHHRKVNTWNEKVDRFITLTEFGREKFAAARFPTNKIRVKPNFVRHSLAPTTEERQDFCLYVGRISEEKGLDTLCQAFSQTNIPLKIAGSGPLLQDLRSKYSVDIEFLGPQTQQQINHLMADARFLVMPSKWYETFGLVIIEAYANMLPVVCSDLGAMRELVKNNETGLHFEAGNAQDLAVKVKWLYDNPNECRQMGENAFREYQEKFTPEINYKMLIDIYQEAINESIYKFN